MFIVLYVWVTIIWFILSTGSAYCAYEDYKSNMRRAEWMKIRRNSPDGSYKKANDCKRVIRWSLLSVLLSPLAFFALPFMLCFVAGYVIYKTVKSIKPFWLWLWATEPRDAMVESEPVTEAPEPTDTPKVTLDKD